MRDHHIAKLFAALSVFVLAHAVPGYSRSFDNFRELQKYDIVWDRPGIDSKASMPLGNGDIGLNVWTEAKTGSVCFYISKTDAWDENGRLLKLSKVRVRIDPNPFRPGEPFLQRLSLAEATVEIEAGKDEGQTRFRIWADAHHPVVRLEMRVPEQASVTASIEPWRIKPETLKDELVSGLNYFQEIFGSTVVQPDVVLDLPSNRIGWYHLNPETPSFAKNLSMQGLDKAPVRNPLKDRIFGAVMEGEGFSKRDHKTLAGPSGGSKELNIHVLTSQPDTPEIWLNAVNKRINDNAAIGASKARASHEGWWHGFWNRSWIYVRCAAPVRTALGLESEGDVVTRAYLLQRFVNACAGRGAYPIKFNGSIFTVEADGTEGFADYRRWGPGYWWQNTRLPYMAMPAAGDFDLMQPFFKMYTDLLPLGRYRTRLYFGHDGVYFPECIYFWGSVFTETWGDKNLSEMAERIQASGWHKYEWVGGLEMATMMFDAYLYTQDKAFLREKFLPFAEAVLTFFEKHYGLDEKGRLKLVPAQALETWWACANPMPEVAGLHYLAQELMRLPGGLLSDSQKKLAERLAAILPPVPTREVDGRKMLAPAERFEKKQNVENPELYAVYPFRLYGIGKPDIEFAVRALDARLDRGHFGWRQDDLFMALLGLTGRAKKGLVERASQWDKNFRFPAFWGPNYDWTPDQDHGGVLAKTLQVMLLQCEDKAIRLLPAWPNDWDATFKLRAPYGTTIEGQILQGKIVKLAVTPSNRRKDIVQ